MELGGYVPRIAVSVADRCVEGRRGGPYAWPEECMRDFMECMAACPRILGIGEKGGIFVDPVPEGQFRVVSCLLHANALEICLSEFNDRIEVNRESRIVSDHLNLNARRIWDVDMLLIIYYHWYISKV